MNAFVEKHIGTYSVIMIFSLVRSSTIRKSAYVNACLFSTDDQSPR